MEPLEKIAKQIAIKDMKCDKMSVYLLKTFNERRIRRMICI